jgi:hypothetical protein
LPSEKARYNVMSEAKLSWRPRELRDSRIMDGM